jgi:ribulose-phosphate 3-epimerase
MSVIAPCITADNADDYKAQVGRIHGFAERVHIDISDGEFTPNFLVDATQVWWPENWQVDIHAMVQRPAEQLASLTSIKPNLIILHAEAEGDLAQILQKIKSLGIKAGIALQRSTVPGDVAPLIQMADHVMIFSGTLGTFGGTANLMQLEKIRLVKAINPSVEIGWDGGVAIDNAYNLTQGGVDVLNVGGAIQKAPDPKAAYDTLVSEINKHGII